MPTTSKKKHNKKLDKNKHQTQIQIQKIENLKMIKEVKLPSSKLHLKFVDNMPKKPLLYSPYKTRSRDRPKIPKDKSIPIPSKSPKIIKKEHKFTQNGSVNRSRIKELGLIHRSSPSNIKHYSSIDQTIQKIKENTMKIDKILDFKKPSSKIIKLHRKRNSKLRLSDVQMKTATPKHLSVFNENKNILKLESENRTSESIFESKENTINKGRDGIIMQRLSLNNKLINEINQKISLIDSLI